jgi:hypothetical protein
MSLTKHQYPAAYTPNWNEQTFEYTSTQTGQSDFKYVIVVTDVLTSASQTYNIKQAPNTAELKWYANVFTNQYIKHYIPNNLYGFKVCTDAIRKITIEVKEYYGGVTYAASPPSTTTYIIWNGVLRTLDWIDYTQTDYVYTNTAPFVYLSSGTAESGYLLSRGETYDDTSLFLYALCNTTSTFETLRVKTYDINGTQLGTSDIFNVYYNDVTYSNKYFCIGVGSKDLTQISSGLVTGTYPIITSSVAYYELYDVNSSVGSPPVGSEQPIRRVDINCSPTYDVWTLHYLAKSGNFETLHFPKKSLKTEVIEKKTYRQNPNTLTSNNWAYTKFSEWEKVQSSTGQETIVMNTDWMNEDQIAQHIEIVSSSRVYIDFGSTIGLVPCKVLTSSIPQNKDISTALFGISLEIQPTYKNNYQHG